MSDLGQPTEDEAAQAMLQLLQAAATEPQQADSYTVAPSVSSSPPALTPYDILQSLALLQQRDQADRPSSASYHPQPTRSGRAPAPVHQHDDHDDPMAEPLEAYIEFPSDSESDDPDFQPRAKRHGKGRSAQSDEEEDEEEDEEGEYMIEADEDNAASGDDEVVKGVLPPLTPPPLLTISTKGRTKLSSKGKDKGQSGTRPVHKKPRFALGPTVPAPPATPEPSQMKKRGRVQKDQHRLPADVKKRRKAWINKINYEKAKLADYDPDQPKSWEYRHQELVVANLELQKKNEELEYRLVHRLD